MIRRRARAWLIRLRSGADPETERKFRHWYQSDPANAAEFDSVKRNFERAALLRQSAESWERELGTPQASPVGPRYAWAAAAAAIALLIPACLLLAGGTAILGGGNRIMLATAVGEIRSLGLGDGSKLTLDTATSVELDIAPGRRRATVRSGRARFDIALGETPFIVDSGDGSVSSAQSRFDVMREKDGSRVDVLAGSAEVSTPGGARTVRGGEGVTATASGARPAPPMAGGSQWPTGMLIFDSTPLGSAVALANRYSDRSIRLSGSLRGIRVTGAFRAGDTAGLARALAAAFNLSLRSGAGGDFVLSGRGESRPAKKNGG